MGVRGPTRGSVWSAVGLVLKPASSQLQSYSEKDRCLACESMHNMLQHEGYACLACCASHRAQAPSSLLGAAPGGNPPVDETQLHLSLFVGILNLPSISLDWKVRKLGLFLLQSVLTLPPPPPWHHFCVTRASYIKGMMQTKAAIMSPPTPGKVKLAGCNLS